MSRIILATFFMLIIALPMSCGSDSDEATDTGTLVFTLNAEGFARDGFVSEDGWRIDFDHVYINIQGPTAYQAIAETPASKFKHAGHPHAEITEGTANEALTEEFFVDGHIGTDPIELGKIENVAIGNYNYMNFDIKQASATSKNLVEAYEGNSIVLIGTAKKDDQSIDFNIKLNQEMNFVSCGPHPENIGVVASGQTGYAEATFHFDHIFGDFEEGPADTDDENTVNYLAIGFAPFAELANDSTLDVTQKDLESAMQKYEQFIQALVTIGHFGEAHCILAD